MNLPTVILLAGGSSSRFEPLKEKNLFKFLGKTLVERQIETLKQHGAQKLIIITNDENYAEIKKEAERILPEVETYVQKGEGQAGAIKTVFDNSTIQGQVLIVNVNDIFEDKLFDDFLALKVQLDQSNECMLTGFKVVKYFPGGYLNFDENDYVTSIVEKPGEGNEPSDYVDIVFHYLNDAQIFNQYLNNAGSEKDDVLEVALDNMMKDGIKFKLLKYEGAWETIKYPWHVLSTMTYFLETISNSQISKNAQIADTAVIKGNVIIEDGVKVFDNAVINGPAYIGKNTIVANNALVRNSMIGDDCVVGFATEIARSYISSSCWFHTNYIGDSVLGENVSLGSGAVTANLRLDEQMIAVNVKGEKINSGMNKLGNIIGANVRIGVNTSLLPGIKIGSNSLVGTGALVDEDIENNKFVYTKQEKIIKDNNFDITKTSREDIRNNLNK